MAQIKSYPNNVNEEIGAENVMRWHHGRTRGVYGAPGELAVKALHKAFCLDKSDIEAE